MAATFSLGDAVLNFVGDLTPLNKALGDAKSKTRRDFGEIQDFANKTGAAMTLMGGAMLAGFGVAAKAAADFDTGMREVNTLINLSEGDFASLKDEVLAFSDRMGIGATEAVGALYQALSAGVPQDNVMSFMEVAAKGAIAGVTDMKTSIDGLSTVVNAFKIPFQDTEKVADLMFTTVRMGKTTFAELSASLSNVAPIAAAAKVPFEQVAGAIATLTKQGVPTAQATTQIRAAIQAVIKPTKEMEERIKALGYESGESMIAQLGLQDTLGKLGEGQTMQGMGKMLGSVEALGATLGLTGQNAQMAASDLKAMTESAGATETAFQQMESSSSDAWEDMLVQLENLKIRIGDAVLPVLAQLMATIEPIVAKVIEWVQANPALVAQIVEWGIGIGAALAVLGPLIIGLGQFAGIINTIMLIKSAGHFTGMAAALGSTGLAGSLALIVGAAGLGWALGRWIDDVTQNTAFGKWVDGMSDTLVVFVEKIKDAIGWLMELFKLKDKEAARPTLGARSEALVAAGVVPAQLPQLATGGDVFRSGMALVGERGPELVRLNAGSRVYDAETSRGMMGAGGQSDNSTNTTHNITIHTTAVVDEAFVKKSQRLAADRKRRQRAG